MFSPPSPASIEEHSASWKSDPPNHTLLFSSVSGSKEGTLIVRITDMTSVGPCGVNSVHEFLQGPEVKCACSSGEESILLYQVESLASSRQVHACLLPAAAWRSDMLGNLHSVQLVQCTNVRVYKPPIKHILYVVRVDCLWWQSFNWLGCQIVKGWMLISF